MTAYSEFILVIINMKLFSYSDKENIFKTFKMVLARYFVF